MRIAGFGFSKKPEAVEADEIMKSTSQRRLRKFHEHMDRAIFDGNREALSTSIKVVDTHLLEKLVGKITRVRATYVRHIIHIADVDRPVGPDEIATLERERRMLEELIHAYDAMVRIIDRGYVELNDHDPA